MRLDRCARLYLLSGLLCVLSSLLLVQDASGQHRTDNFICQDKAIAEAAEAARKDSAVFWTGQDLAGEWNKPCPIFVQPGPESGVTSMSFAFGEVFGWRMDIRGSQTGLLQDVLPHEVDHAVRATLTRHPIVRWADEGSSTLFESAASHEKMRRQCAKYLARENPVVFRYLTAAEYPRNASDVYGLYATGFSLVEYLLTRHDAATLLAFQKSERPIADRLQQFYATTPQQLQADWRKWFLEKSLHGFDCQSFGCCRHASAKPDVSPEPILYCFSQPACPGCERFKADVRDGCYDAYNVVVLTRSEETDWKFSDESVYELMRESVKGLPEDSRKLSVPTFWVPSASRVQVGYAVEKKERLGLVDWIIETIKRHLIPSAFFGEDPPPGGTVSELGESSEVPESFVRPEQGSTVPETTEATTSTVPMPAQRVDWGDLTLVVSVGKLTEYLPTIRREMVDRLTRQIDRVVLERTGGKLSVRVVAEVSEPQRHRALTAEMGLDSARVAVVVFVRRQDLGFAKSMVRDLVVREINERVGEVLKDAPVVVVLESAEPAAYHAGLNILAQPEPELPALVPVPDPISTPDAEPGETSRLGTVLSLVEELSHEVKAIKGRNADEDPSNDGPTSPTGVLLSAVLALVTRKLACVQGLVALFRKLTDREGVI